MAGGSDTMPEEASKNAPPPDMEELGGDPGRGGSSAPPPSEEPEGAKSGAPPPSEEPEGDEKGGLGAVGRLLIWNWEEEELEGAENGGGDAVHVNLAENELQDLRTKDAKKASREAEAAAAAASATSSREPPLDEGERKRIRKGKMPAATANAVDETAAPAPARSPAGSDGGSGDKLMGDAIRAHRSSGSKKRKDLGPSFWYGLGSKGTRTSMAGSDLDCSFDKIGVVSGELRDALKKLDLGADPKRVYGRMMTRSDRDPDQARLQMPWKRSRAAKDGEFPLSAFLTEADKKKMCSDDGLTVQAYDKYISCLLQKKTQ